MARSRPSTKLSYGPFACVPTTGNAHCHCRRLRGSQANSSPPPRSHTLQVLAKIESADAVDNLDSILDAVDGAMVARGDLGAELPVECVPFWQSAIVQVRTTVTILLAHHSFPTVSGHWHCRPISSMVRLWLCTCIIIHGRTVQQPSLPR
jgi:hypothetical protein